jgi:cytochrome c oxidase cbb3-type subunit 3
VVVLYVPLLHRHRAHLPARLPGPWQLQGLLGWQSSNQDVRSLAESKAAAASAKAEGRAVEYDRELAKADEIYGAKFRELTYQADGKSYKEITEIAKDPKP